MTTPTSTQPVGVEQTTVPAVPEAPPAQAKPETDWKAEARKHEARAKENAAAASELAALKESQKTETQKLADRLAAAEKAAADRESEALRMRVALTKGVPAELVDRLRGDDEAAMNEDADRLLALLAPGRPKGNADQGARTTAGPSSNADVFAEWFKSQK